MHFAETKFKYVHFGKASISMQTRLKYLNQLSNLNVQYLSYALGYNKKVIF